MSVKLCKDTVHNDSCSEAGATKLAETIRKYWRAKGYNVEVKAVQGPFRPILRTASYYIKSDLCNGLPQDYKEGN